MKLWELINMSDEITFEGDDKDAVECAVLLLGEGSYGANCHDDKDLMVPIALLPTPEYTEHVEELVNRCEDNKAFNKTVGEVLLSFRYGSVKDWKSQELALKHIPEDKQATYLKEQDDLRRTSWSEIVNRAHQLGDFILKEEES